MSAEDDADEQYEAECGHMVGAGEAVSLREIGTVCEACYTPAGVTKWPTVLHSEKSYSGHTRHGRVEYHTTQTMLLGLDRRGRGVYWDQSEGSIKYAVPMNDSAYRKDRADARERWDRKLYPLRKHHIEPGSPGHPGPYLTLPNNDHITVVERDDVTFRSHEHRELTDWLREHTGDWQAFRPDLVGSYDLQDRFGDESGLPLENAMCGDCGHVEESFDPMEHTHCPECGSFKLSAWRYEEEQ